MTNLTELEFAALDISGKNYFLWASDVKMYLAANGLKEAIREENTMSLQERAKAMIILRHHLHEKLKTEYWMVEDPSKLWKLLEKRYHHLKQEILSKARDEWAQLRFQDFKSVSEYNSAIFRIKSELKIGGDNIDHNDMLHKTFSTFHPLNMVLQEQYRLRGFKTYYELIPCLLVAEQNNELVMKSHRSHPVRRDTSFGRKNQYESFKYKRGRGPRGAHGRGWLKNACYKCGSTNHLSRRCNTPNTFS